LEEKKKKGMAFGCFADLAATERKREKKLVFGMLEKV